MKTNGFVILLLFAGVLLGFNACKSDPIVIDIVGEPIVTPGEGEIVNMVETNVCGDNEISFQYEILPLMVSNCATSGCHDAKTRRDGVVLDSYANIRREVKKGDPNDSEIYESITENRNDEDFMPPRPAKALSANEVSIIRKWIAQGAKNTDCTLPCDSKNTSFVNNVFPMIKQACTGCHQSSNRRGNVSLENYNQIQAYALNGILLGTIKQENGYSAMPPSGNKMTDCQIATIQNWIIEGALNN